jgi:hypothetical protein
MAIGTQSSRSAKVFPQSREGAKRGFISRRERGDAEGFTRKHKVDKWIFVSPQQSFSIMKNSASLLLGESEEEHSEIRSIDGLGGKKTLEDSRNLIGFPNFSDARARE